MIFNPDASCLHRDQNSSDVPPTLPILPQDKCSSYDQTLVAYSLMDLDPPIASHHNNNTINIKFSIPYYLRIQPPKMKILEEYKRVILHGGWSLIPSDISNKFILNEPSLPTDTSKDLLDEELVEWGDDEDQDFLVEDFEDEENFLEEVNPSLEVQDDFI